MFLEKVVDTCHKTLLTSSSVLPLAYLISRGITLEDIKKYQIGYFSKSFNNIVDKNKNTEIAEFNKWLGYRGRFIAKRIVFPIRDELGQIKGIETRGLDQGISEILLAKYKEKLKDKIRIELPERTVRYKKFYLSSYENSAFFFGIPQTLKDIWETKTVLVTEGIFDCISLLKIKKNCVSSLTANINDFQLSWIKRYANNIILFFDNDKKGKRAVYTIKKALEKDCSVWAINLRGHDLNEYIMKYGVTDLKWEIEEKLSLTF